MTGKTGCTLTIRDHDGLVVYDGQAGVGLRGRSSSTFPKPQYAVELRDNLGEDNDVDLFGMGSDADWILNGLYIDRALFRNKLAFDLFRSLTHDVEWAPQSVYVELDVNGEYVGVYALVERIEHGGARAPVATDDGTGASFIVRADESGFPSALQFGSWDVVYPKTSLQTPLVMGNIEARLQRVETAVAADGADVFAEIDLDSAVAFVLLEEFFKNNDAYFLSHHLYTGDDGKLRFIPWDLDLSLGQPIYNDNENPETWILSRSDFISRIGTSPGFQDRMTSMWAEWRAAGLSDDVLDALLDENPALLGDAVARNFDRWPIETINFFGDNLTTVRSIDEEQQRVSAFVHARVLFIDDNVATWSTTTP